MTTNNDQQYSEQLRVLQERFPQATTEKLTYLLKRFNGDADQVRARLIQRDFRENQFDELEQRFGATVTALQQEFPSAQGVKRIRLLKMLARFSGDVEQVRKFLQKSEHRHTEERQHGNGRRHQRQEELKTKYATQLAELAGAGVNVNNPCILRQLEKNEGDATKVLEITTRRRARNEKMAESDTKYANEIAQLEADGVEVKNKRVLARLLAKSDGQVDVVKQLLNERKVKHEKRREYREKHRGKSPSAAAKQDDKTGEPGRKRRELSGDDWENLKRLRSAGVHGNPKKILEIFHQCHESVEMTVARTEAAREERIRNRDERITKRKLLGEADNAYINVDKLEDWPENIEQVYLDGNNMMFVVNSLRRLCLNRAGQKTERAIGEIASAWNERMRIFNIDLIFDSTRQLEQIGTVKVSSAQPKYRTTDDMLVELARRPENQGKNKRTIVVTSDRALATLLQREGCLLIKPYSWFAHCVMVLTPDLINYEEITGMMTTSSTPTTFKVRYNFDELVHRIATIDL